MSEFDQLPDEILLKIFYDSSISARSLVLVSNVCKRFQNICCSEEKLWKSKIELSWPLVMKEIKSGKENLSLSKIGKKEAERFIKISNKFKEILKTVKYQLYKFKRISQSVLSSISKMLNLDKFGLSVVLSELRYIIKDERGRTDKINLLYAKTLFYHVNYYLNSQKIKEFFRLPRERQILEKGTFYLSKGLHPEEFFDIEYEEVSSKLDKLALEVQSYLSIKNPNHPAVSIELISPEVPLQNSVWSHDQTSELFETIRHVLCMKHPSEKHDNFRNIYHHKCSSDLLELDNYFSILFKAVRHRLGIQLHPILCDGNFYFKWESSDSEVVEITHPYNEAMRNARNRIGFFLISPYEYTIKEILFDLAKDSFRKNDFVKRKHFGFIPENVISVGMILLMQNFSENFNADFYRNSEAFTICLDNELHLEAIIETYDKLKDELAEYELDSNLIIKFRDEAKRLLNVQLNRPKLITPKKRTRTVNAIFATGIPVTDNKKLMFGVIIGWDKDYNLINDMLYKGKYYFGDIKYLQTYYIVLLKNGTTCYVPEEILIFYDEPLPDTLYEIWKYFTGYNGIFYKPNKELLSEYPDDEKIRKQFYRVYEGRKKKTQFELYLKMTILFLDILKRL